MNELSFLEYIYDELFPVKEDLKSKKESILSYKIHQPSSNILLHLAYLDSEQIVEWVMDKIQKRVIEIENNNDPREEMPI